MTNPIAMVFVAVLLGSNASADEGEDDAVEEVIQELFLGQTVYPQERFELQLTGGVRWHRMGPDTLDIPFVIEYGITDRLQIELEGPLGIQPVTGFGSLCVGLMYNFFSDRDFGVAPI